MAPPLGRASAEGAEGIGEADNLNRAAAVLTDIRARGHTPTWTTSPDNIGGLAVAERLGFLPERNDVSGQSAPPSPATDLKKTKTHRPSQSVASNLH
jgi:hypothetical protein